MRTKLGKIALGVFNWVFSSRISLEDIDSIKLISRGGIRIAEKDVESIRLLTKENLRIRDEDVESIRFLANGISAKSFGNFRKLVLLNRLDDLGDISEGIPLSYSQEGEDLILNRIFNYRSEGFYVDVGAHHPKRFSNTYSFYKRGWRGINIDPTPGVKELFDELRSQDITLSVSVSSTVDKQDFYIFNESALNTFSRNLAEEYQNSGYKLLGVMPIKSKKLSSLLEEYINDKPIDFMSIDVEDHELQVLQSNDWNKFRPQILLVEILNFDMNQPEGYPVHNFIVNNGYSLLAKTYNTLFYRDSNRSMHS